MVKQLQKDLVRKIEELQNRLEESEQLIDAIKAGEVDAFAIRNNGESEIYTLQSGDYAYRVLVEELEESAINVTEEGLIIYTNPHFFRLLKLSYEKVISTYIFDFIHPDSQEVFRRLFSQSLSGKSKGEINFLVNGTIIPAYVSLTSLQPKLSSVGILITDLTERKHAEEQILKASKELEGKNIELENSQSELLRINKELESFNYVASHDLQEPLRKIETFIHLMNKNMDDAGTLKKYADKITLSSQRMSLLIQNVLEYSRVSHSSGAFQQTDLNIIIENVKTDFELLIEEKKATIKNEPLPVIKAIPLQMQQLFANLISNSLKFSEKNPQIKITAKIINGGKIKFIDNANAHRDFAEIKFADNGIGFEPQYAEQIFDLFQRLHGKSAYEGTGVGLSIVKKIVEQHNGYIRATSEKNKGSTFTLWLPVE